MTECLGYAAQSGGADVVEGKVLLANVSRVNKRCNENVVPRLDFGAAGSSLVFCRASILASGIGRAFGSEPNSRAPIGNRGARPSYEHNNSEANLRSSIRHSRSCLNSSLASGFEFDC